MILFFRLIKFWVLIFFICWVACCIGYAILLYIFPLLSFISHLHIDWPTKTELWRYFLAATWSAFLASIFYVYTDWYQNRPPKDFE